MSYAMLYRLISSCVIYKYYQGIVSIQCPDNKEIICIFCIRMVLETLEQVEFKYTSPFSTFINFEY